MSTRAERRKRVAARVAAGELPARHKSHFQTADVREAVQDELAAQRAAMAARRARVRNIGLQASSAPAPAPGKSLAEEQRDVVLGHLAEAL